MKVYELMSALASLPSGADVMCSATLTVSELERGEQLGEDVFCIKEAEIRRQRREYSLLGILRRYDNG